MKATAIAATVLLAAVAVASSAATQDGASVRCVGEACGPIVGDEKFDTNQRREQQRKKKKRKHDGRGE
ncbi:hypothetical protein LEL_05683 [Akanthomyces lecanii RCEF 1005]|uniref:Uncharacterized protein n=1 Tax=Akanthomyces lecanii RCEF 1005 TaxID=1081108 RepID=A0A162N5T8_CORDF|nr:hypothetical protein LEL_05683 [Akanthomyces lecanii RCEF 1005]